MNSLNSCLYEILIHYNIISFNHCLNFHKLYLQIVVVLRKYCRELTFYSCLSIRNQYNLRNFSITLQQTERRPHLRCGCFRCMQINKLFKKTIIRIFLGVSRQFDHITLTFLITTLPMFMQFSIFITKFFV